MLQQIASTTGRDWFRGEQAPTFGDDNLSRLRVTATDTNGNPTEFAVMAAEGGSITGSKISAEDLAEYVGGKDSLAYRYLKSQVARLADNEGG